MAVIERHTHRPVGTRLLVCADQGVPRGWSREHHREASGDCPGARVRADAPTAMSIVRRH